MTIIALHANRDIALYPLVGESWRGECSAVADRIYRLGSERPIRFARRAPRATPLPTLPHKGEGDWRGCPMKFTLSWLRDHL